MILKGLNIFLNDEKITYNDLSRYAWIITDGHYKVVSALNVSLSQLETSIDDPYVDKKDFI